MFEKIKMKNLIRAVYILMIIALIIGVTYSRYMASLLGTDSVYAATFVVTNDIVESTTVEIPYDITTDGETYTYELIITNYYESGQVCDVDMDYTVELSYTDNLPLDIVLRETNNTVSGYGTVATEDKGVTYTISDASFPHTEEVEHIYYIEVSWQEEASKDYNLSYEIDVITVTITAEQSMEGAD